MKKMIEVRFIAIGEELESREVAKAVSDTVKETLGAELGSLKVREIEEVTEEDVHKALDDEVPPAEMTASGARYDAAMDAGPRK